MFICAAIFSKQWILFKLFRHCSSSIMLTNSCLVFCKQLSYIFVKSLFLRLYKTQNRSLMLINKKRITLSFHCQYSSLSSCIRAFSLFGTFATFRLTSGGMLSSESELSSEPCPSMLIWRSWSMVASTAPLLERSTHSITS